MSLQDGLVVARPLKSAAFTLSYHERVHCTTATGLSQLYLQQWVR